MTKVVAAPVETVSRVRRFAFWWPTLNLAGIALYLRLASTLWPLPGEEHLPGGPGDAFVWILEILPLQVIAVAANTGAFVLVLRNRKHRDGPINALIVVTVATLWLCAVVYDQERSFRWVRPLVQSEPQRCRGRPNGTGCRLYKMAGTTTSAEVTASE